MSDDSDRGKLWLRRELGASPEAIAKLERFVAALRYESTQQNLVASASLEHVWWRHVADSAQLLLLARRLGMGAGPWLDLGSGAGFPGLVVGLLEPHRTVRLIEERRRRVEWLIRSAVDLDLTSVEVIGAALNRVPSAPAAVISARAFAPLPKLLRLAARFSTSETIWLLPKGERSRQEVNELPEGLRAMFHVEQSVTHSDAGIVVGRGIPAVVTLGD